MANGMQVIETGAATVMVSAVSKIVVLQTGSEEQTCALYAYLTTGTEDRVFLGGDLSSSEALIIRLAIAKMIAGGETFIDMWAVRCSQAVSE